MNPNERVSLVVRNEESFWDAWSEDSAQVPLRFVTSLHEALCAVSAGVHGAGAEIGSIVVDRAAPADAVLDLLAALPAEFTGDVLYIRRDRSGLVSAMARGGGRVIYALAPDDVQFYLGANGLMARTGMVNFGLRAIA